jgi:hypothetical protein
MDFLKTTNGRTIKWKPLTEQFFIKAAHRNCEMLPRSGQVDETNVYHLDVFSQFEYISNSLCHLNFSLF